MGHGVNQRAQIKMTPEEIEAFLHERRPVSLCSINHDGSIHAVAMWYGFLDGMLAFETKAKSQKAQNLRRNPTMTCMAEDGDFYEELRGVELVGTAEFIDSPNRMFKLGINLFERYYGTYTEDLRPFVETMLNKRVVVALHRSRRRLRQHAADRDCRRALVLPRSACGCDDQAFRSADGNVVYQLTQIDRSEPPAGLFEVPPGYRGVGTKPKGKDKK